MLMVCFPFAGGHARLLHDCIDRDTLEIWMMKLNMLATRVHIP